MIEIKKLKHGSVPVTNVPDFPTRDVAMKLNENILGLAEQVLELQKATQALQREVSGLSAKVYALENP